MFNLLLEVVFGLFRVKVMAELLIVRHAQASFGADNYDKLSPLGHQQSHWLGEHFKSQEIAIDQVIAGDMTRHIETAKGVLSGLGQDVDIDTTSGFNEFNFSGLLTPLKHQFPDDWTETGDAGYDYYQNIYNALIHWMEGRIASDGQDSWMTFCERIENALLCACKKRARRTLVVTSGGPASVIIAQILELNSNRTLDICLQIKNSSVSRLLYDGQRLSLDGFNDVAHLAKPDRQHAATFF